MLPCAKRKTNLMSASFICPKTEVAWVRYYDGKGQLRYIITSNKTRDSYFLYDVAEMQTKLGKGKTPRDLESKYDILSHLCK